MNDHQRIPVYIAVGLPGAARSLAIAQLLALIPPESAARTSLVLEGAPPNGAPEVPAGLVKRTHILAPGCPCCLGQLTLRVTLARILRLETPRSLVIGLLDAGHEASLRQLFAEPPWTEKLECVAAKPTGRSPLEQP